MLELDHSSEATFLIQTLTPAVFPFCTKIFA